MASRLLIALVCGIIAMMGILLYCNTSVPQLHGSSLKRHYEKGTGDPIYAIADLHGDYSKAVKALQLAGLVGKDGYWSGSKASIVQLGDLMDRGAYSLDCVNLFERLKGEASKTGGKVETLLGNHELMNLEGVYQYVSRQELQRLIKDLEPESLSGGQQAEQALSLWKRRLQPDRDIGQALRQRPVAVLKGHGKCRTLFVHAGMLPGLLNELDLHRTDNPSPEDILQDLNESIRGALKCIGGTCKPSESALRRLHDPEGFLWSRAYTQRAESQFCPAVSAVLRRLGAAQMVVGHNVVTGGKPKVLCKKALYMMDVGMSDAYVGADPTVWKCYNGHVSILG